MKRDTFQRKRRPTKGRTFAFYSKTQRNKKQRVAAGAAPHADLGSEVPNLGVARALVVILVLHVAAVAAILIHNRVTNDDPVVEKSALQEETAAVTAFESPEPMTPAQPSQTGEEIYFVATGDTYARIAADNNIPEAALRELNNSRRLQAGAILRIPARGTPPAGSGQSAAVVPGRPNDPDPDGVEDDSTPAPGSDPVVVVDASPPEGSGGGAIGRAVIVEPDPGRFGAVVIKPRRNPLQAGTQVGNAPAATPTGPGGSYTVKPGDTPWGIAKRYKTTPTKLLAENGLSDPRKLRIGMTLKIPASN